MGNTKNKSKGRASRPAGHPTGPSQPSITGYVGPSDGIPLDDSGMVPGMAGAGAGDPYALTGWGAPSGIGSAQDVTCPSGQLALVKRPGVQGLIEAGVLHEMDSLTGLVESKHIRRVKGGAPEVDVKSLLKEPKQLESVMSVVDRILVYVVVKPELALAWEEKDGTRTEIPMADRKPDKVYTDQIELDDKMFIFNYAVGGTRNLERFREQSEAALAGVDAGGAVEGEAE